MAYRLGDNTAKRAGRLTLNPIRHIDPMGLLMMVVFRFGWARPVPVDMRNFKNPKRGMALTALAGPVSNLLLAAVALLLYGLLFIPLRRMGGAGEFIGQFLTITAYLSTALAVFNILPIPPLDGSKVLGAALSDRAYWSLMRFERYGMIALVAILLLVNNLNLNPLGVAAGWVYDRLFLFAQWGFQLVSKFM